MSDNDASYTDKAQHRSIHLALNRIAGSILLCLSLVSAAHSQNLVSNGSFETGNLNGWTANQPFFVTNYYGATDGIYALEFAYGEDSGATLSQTISTVVGVAYNVSFDWKATHPDSGQSALFTVQNQTLTGAQLAQIGVSGGYTGLYNQSLPYSHFSVSFVANSAQTVINFADTSASTFQKDQMLDNVSVLAAPIPEPETYAMLLAGLGLIGAAVKRRKAKRA